MGIFGKKTSIKVFSVVHIGGLDVPADCKCEISSSVDEIIVRCCGTEYVLKLKNIRNIEYQMDIDEKQYLKSSVIKGVVGAATFGATGAIIGSRPKEKIKREVSGYAIISYESINSECMTIVFKDELPNTLQCARLVDEIKPKIKLQINRMEL